MFTKADHFLDLSFHSDCKCSVGYEETKSKSMMFLLVGNLILIVGARVEASSFIFGIAEFVVREVKVELLIHLKLLHL